MIDLDFSGDPDSGMTTEAWVKHDLEAGDVATMWLGNAVVDALDQENPVAYLEAVLAKVDAPPEVKIAALIRTVVSSTSDACYWQEKVTGTPPLP